ncbi:non-ribosomal peptide synthetase/type I polyketide synthase [Streptomyces sp. IB201691-2A2]|uniref:non-ribosomal peptide synthetase/type I polyketide synthase n=1 Tax=Streptomyces sp. IB201691-2A2 TaxID=2561920 RepID=UPI00117CBF48|nr:non-ribosomal peptide synthetase/type I polyketide synthase [Streptomyces sp. IB201691-2A2]TRO59413.1 amino acid adenylation domain-containing protein [Streptomyces sp. IB201691-2A2]
MKTASLFDVLLDAARQAPEQVVVHVRGDGSEVAVTFRELLDESLRVAGGYRGAGVEPGTCVPLLAERSEDFQPMFWGALAAGLVPVPLAPDARRVAPVWEHLGRPPVVVDAACAGVTAELPSGVRVLRLETLRECAEPVAPVMPGPDDLAFLQFSSGSTGSPKGVELTHAAVVANLRQMAAASALNEQDVVVSWMPYFHDMGLIGTHLAPLAVRAKQVKIGPLSFAKTPRLWFDVAAAHRATVLSAANFALALAVRRVPDEVLAAVDLSPVRLMLVGAEPISATVWRDFAAKMRPTGLDPRAATPVYGLAEATLAVTFPPLGEVAAPVALDRAALSRGRAVEREPGGDAVEVMDVGVPVPGCAVRITDGAGRPLGDRRVGHIEVGGPQIARGYHRLPETTAQTFAEGWLRTGDLGFLRDGRLCVSGRHKDVLFLNGRTFHAPDMEEVAAATPGLPTGITAVVGSTDPVTGSERVVVFVSWSRPPRTATEVLDQVARRVRGALGHDDVHVLALPPSAFPRTTSGKLQRQRMRARFEAGSYRPAASSGPLPIPSAPSTTISDTSSAAVPSGASAPAPSGSAAHGPRQPDAVRRSAPPRSRADVRQLVRDVWTRVLARPGASFTDRDRFADLGGTSLKAMEVLAELEHALDVALAPAVMRDDTVAALTDQLLAAVDDDTSGRRSPATGQGTPPAPAVAPATAIVAMACRFPGASTPEEFWDLLAAGRDAVTAVPPGRWDGTPSAQAGASSTWSGGRWGSFLDDPAAFDAGHFGIGDEEARTLDPQARIFLELAHEALERAGYAGDRRRGLRVGVFAAVGDSGYRQILADAAPAGAPPAATALTGNLPNLVAARVAHCLDLDGPALAVDTACSSGLVALHLARRSLADGECDIAVVGGVNLHLTPDGYQALESAQALSPTGRSRAFSTAADGFAPGEGGAALVLRPLEEAGRDNDEILAVVRGTAVNNDGTSLSLMAPNPQRQHEAIGRAYEICGVDPRSVTYVEAHGTGTAVGDPIELRSLAQAFPADPDGRPRLLGSVKTNVGHLLNSAALPSLVKVVLALGHGRLPASLHHTSPSPAVERSGFALVTELTDWESHDPLRAGINAFGFGGTNAHAVLEQAPPAPASAPAPRAGGGPHLLTLSARSADGLAAWTSRLAGHLRDHPELDEGDVCLTAATARDEGPHRLALVADGDLRERLAEATAARDGRPPGVATGTVANRPRTVFVFPGQGALRPGQGRALYATAPVYRGTLDEASALVGAVHGRQLTSWCVDAEVDPQAQAATEVAQPLLVAHGVALARQLMAWGVRPDALVGHSVGELAAACVGGVLSLADAVWFAAERGRLMGTLTSPGSMLAVRGADEQDVAALVAASPGELAVAAYNGPGRLVISGSPDAVEQAAEKLAGLGAAVRPLRVSHAFHSPLMEPVARALADAARTLDTGVAGLPVMSTLTAGWQPRMDPDHLREHALRPVLFGRAVARLLDEGYDTFVELGPDENLAGPIRAAAAHHGVTGTDGTRVLVVSAPGERDRAGTAAEGGTPGGARELLETVGRLWTRGVTLDRTALDAGRRRVTLPPYPYQRRRYWPDTAAHGLLHRVTWQAAPLADDAPAGPVLVTGPDATAVRELAAQLAGRGTEATTDPEVVAAQTVVLLAGSTGRGTAAEFERMQRRWVTAFQEALALFDRTGARRLLVVTQDVHVTGHGSERPDPAQAVLGALALAVPEEFPGAVANWVDLASLDGSGQRLRAVLAEVAAPQAAGVVAWRDGQRLVRTVVPQPAETPHGGERLPADGTFLITGGCGGIGSALARDLAGRGRPVVILTGRSPQPPEGLVEELAALGADARYHPADLAAQDDVDKLVAELPRLDGVFHAAGVVRPGSLRSTGVQEAVDALRAKTLGTTLLSEALHRHGQRPAVCVAFSSVSSVLPGLAGALGVYAAANAFLDAFAVSERQAGRPWLSVNLGPFAETGLASSLGAGVLARAGIRPLATAPALAALRSACDTDAAQLVLADPASVPGPPLADSPRRPVEMPQHQAAAAAARRPSGADGPTSVSGAAAVLRELLAQSLGVPVSAVDDDAPFLSLGLDSLGAVDLVKRLERRTGRPWPTTLFFEYRTVRELAAHLDTRAVAGADAVEPGPDAHRGLLPAAVDDGTPFALTPVQLALHTSSRLHPDVPARGHLRLTIRGPLDTHVLGRALTALAERHGMLRLRIDDAGAAPLQRLAPTTPLQTWYEVREGTGQSLADVESELCNRRFDLAVEPPVRAVVLRQEPSLAHLLLVVHHAAADGYSLNVLAEDLWALYTSLWRGERPQLIPPALDFATYAAARVHSPGSNNPDATRRYWAERLAGRGEPLRLPYDGDPDAPPSGPLVQHHGALDAALTTGLERLAAAHDVSLFHLLLAAYVRCLVRWTGRRDIAVNVARAGRDDRFEGVDRLVGPLADTLPLLCEADLEEPVVALAERLRRAWLESERHADLSSLDLAGLLSGAGGGPRTASPAGFSFARFPARPAADCPVEVRATAAGTGSAATRLSLLCWADGPVLRMSWNFPLPLFERRTVARLDREYREELAALCALPAPPATALAPAEVASPDSGVTSASLAGSDGGPSLVDRLLDRFRATPTATAVDSGAATLTYAALDRASDRLAARLRALGVRPGSLVGLLTEPGPDTVIGVVGILRAGAGWVPLDAGHPTARMADQLARTGATTVVCHASTLSTANALGGVRAVAVDDLPSAPVAEAVVPVSTAEAEAIAYVIFTSGSTGRPKAVPITHRAMENYLDWAVATFGYGAQDRLAQTASPCFDASVRQLLAPLLVGATVVTVPQDLRRDPELLLAYVERARITVWSSVPTLWEQLLSAAEEQVRREAGRPDLSALRWVHVGGEALPAAHVRRWFDLFGTGTRIANLYGPTEATINATCHVIDVRPDDDVQLLPIGRAVAGTDLEVVRPDGTPCGRDEFGELLIAGVGLTPGYLGEPDLTTRAFAVRDGRRWYRSGDRVRRGEGGTLEFLGRVDDQVKIRGNRVEPGEVEAALQTHPGIARAAVTAREGRLLAFVTVRPGSGRPATRDVRRHLSDVVPPFMVPARITVVDALPLTGTGKVDRRALSDRASAPADRAGRVARDAGAAQEQTSTARLSSLPTPSASLSASTTALSTTADRGTPPATPTERRLAAIWSELLEAGPVCREDDFFDLGGDSMLVLQVFARLGDQEGPLPRPTAVYRHRTLAALAAAVDAAVVAGEGQPCRTETATAAGSRSAGEDHTAPFPLTPGQRGFLLAEELSPGGGAWLARLRLTGPLDQEVFQTAVDLLVERHAMLRTVFPSGARPPVQQELPRSLRLPVVFETLRDRGDVDERAAAEAGRRFEPWTWPLLRLRVLTLAPHEHVLLVHAHHLIGDGYSAALLMQELTDAYDRLVVGHTAEPSSPPRATFRDHCLLLAETVIEAASESRAGSGSAPGAAQRRARLGAPYRPPVLRALNDDTGSGSSTPTDGATPAFHSAEFVLDASRTAALRVLAAEAGATLYAPLLTAYYQQLAEVTGQADLILGLAVSGRDRPLPDVHRIFGPFAAAVPMRPDGTTGQGPGEGPFGDALRRIVTEAEEARTHEDVLPRHANGLPLTSQFFFTFLDFSALAAPNGGTLTVSWEDADSAFAPPSTATDVFMAVRPDGDGLRVTLRGSANAFSPPALDGFAQSIRARLTRASSPGLAVRRQRARETMDAALVGYLPAPDHLARLAGLPDGALPRAELRTMLFPDGAPRLLETVETPLGRSGFVCVPLFADELGRDPGLVRHAGHAVSLASSLGARCVSLAGMIPSLTGYGFDVLSSVEGAAAVTTGHAATVVSVVKTVRAALDATGQNLADLDVAFVGLGSIGSSSLELLLAQAPRPPRRLLLCDVRGSAPRLEELARNLRERGLAGEVEVVESRQGLPDAVYGTDLLVTAISGSAAVLEVDRLRPGTTVIDDSFPHCFDTTRALARMRDRQDVLVLGGGLLHIGRTHREPAEGLPATAAAGYLAQPWIEGTLASCRTESLLHASLPELPLVHGLVDRGVAHAYARAVEQAGVTAAPLHLLGHVISSDVAVGLPRKR